MIFEQDIKKERQQKWHVTESTRPLRTLDDAREFLNSVGFCLAYPVKPSALAPTFIGAYAGTQESLPTAKQAFADANARAATELVVRLLSEKSAFEVAFGDDGSLLVSAAEFPYFYALVGDRNPKVAPSPGLRNEQALTTHTFEVIDQHGPINEDQMRRKLGREISRNAIEKVLHALWSKLRITRVDAGLENGEPVEPVWDLMHRWAPELIARGKQISAGEALSALISKYLETVITAGQTDIEDFFGRLVPRSKVAEVCKALLAAQEFTYVQVSGKTMLRLASRGEDAAPIPGDAADPKVHKVRPWQAREQGKRASEEKRAKFAERPANAFQKFAKDRPRKEFGERKPFGERTPFGEKRLDDRRPRRAEASGPRKPFGDKPQFRDKPRFGERKPFDERKPFSDRAKTFGDTPRFGKDRRPRRDSGSAHEPGSAAGKSFAERGKPFGERKTFGGKNRPSHNRERFAGRPGEGHAPRNSARDDSGKRDFKGDYRPRRDNESPERSAKPFGKSFGGKRSFGDKKPFGRSFGAKKSFGAKPFNGKSVDKRKPASGERPPWLRDKKPREGPAE